MPARSEFSRACVRTHTPWNALQKWAERFASRPAFGSALSTTLRYAVLTQLARGHSHRTRASLVEPELEKNSCNLCSTALLPLAEEGCQGQGQGQLERSVSYPGKNAAAEEETDFGSGRRPRILYPRFDKIAIASVPVDARGGPIYYAPLDYLLFFFCNIRGSDTDRRNNPPDAGEATDRVVITGSQS